MTAWRFVAPPAGRVEPGPVPSFSVVIAAHNAADTIASAVESALAQTRPPAEVIVVDDGSTDATADALTPFLDRVTSIGRRHEGVSAARNAGVRASTAEFFAILDADDVFEPRRLEALGALAADRPDLDIVMSDLRLCMRGRSAGTFCAATPFEASEQRLAIFDRCFIAAPAVRRATFLDAGGFDEAIANGEDWDCWIRLLLRGARAGLVDEPLYDYRLTEGSLTDDRVDALRARVTVLEKAMRNPDLREDERPPLVRALAHHERRARLAEAEEALRRGAAGARRRALAVAAGRGFGARTRAKAAIAAAAPRWAGRRLEAREATTGRSRLKRSPPA